MTPTRSRRRFAIQLGIGAVTVATVPAADAQRRDAVEVNTARVGLSFAPGALKKTAAAEFLKLLDEGVLHLEEALSLPRFDGQIRFRVSRRVRISNAYRTTVNLPLWRFQQRAAPYLHETTHVLMGEFAGGASPPTWLAEGFASYLEGFVADIFGGYDAHVFTREGNRSVDAESREHLETATGREVVPYIGADNEMPALSTDRARVAPAFYCLSQSLVKFLAEQTDIQTVRDLHRRGAVLVQPLDALRSEWLRSLKPKERIQ